MARVIRTTDDRIIFAGEGAIRLPVGNTAPAVPDEGWIRYNSSALSVEFYNGIEWQNLIVSAGATIVSGTFVLRAGDVMTGSLGLPTGSFGNNSLYFVTPGTGLFSPNTSQLDIQTNSITGIRVNENVIDLGNLSKPITVNNSFLGIGIALPGGHLHIEDQFGVDVILETNTADANARIVFLDTFSQDPVFDMGFNASSQAFTVETFDTILSATTVQFIITSAGNIGTKGIDDPTISFMMGGNDGLKIPVGTSAQRPPLPENGTMRYNTGSGLFEFFQSGSWITIITTSAVLAVTGSRIENASTNTSVDTEAAPAENRIRFRTAGTQRMVIDEFGRVGIGIDPPQTTLNLESGSTFRIGDTNDHFQLRQLVNVGAVEIRTSLSAISFTVDLDSSITGFEGTADFFANTFTDGALSLNVYEGQGNVNHKFSNGVSASYVFGNLRNNFGVGTNNPQADLHLYNDQPTTFRITSLVPVSSMVSAVSAGISALVTALASAIVLFESDFNISVINLAETNILFRNNEGAGSINVDFEIDSTEDAFVNFFRDTGTLGDTGLVIYLGDGTPTINHTFTNSNSYVVADSGNFGVGTNSPLSKLHVDGTIRAEVSGGYYTMPSSAGNPGDVLTSNGVDNTTYWAPASVFVNGYFVNQVNSTVVAAGTTQGAATPLDTSVVIITTSVSGVNDGVILPTEVSAPIGTEITIFNNAVSAVNVYPHSGGQINSFGVNIPYNLASTSIIKVIRISTNNWVGYGSLALI